jgi:hypothetical protein
MNKLFLYTILFLGMMALLAIVFGVAWAVLNCFISVSYWTVSGTLSSLGFGYCVLRLLYD